MTKINVGVQAMMLKGKFDELGAYDTLKKVHELGYGSVEISQIPMNAANVDAMRRAQDDFGIKIAAVSAGVAPNGPMPQETIATHFDKIVADCKALDCNFVRIGMLPFGCMASLDEVLHFCRMANVAAQKLADQGIKLYYHNHHIEFTKYDGQYLLDIIRDTTRYMGFELDIHWIQRGGENPVAFIRKYAGRIRLLHLKDYRIGTFRMPEKFDPQTFAQAFSSVVEFAEVGEGSLPIAECIQAGLEGGSEYFLIEQDDTYGRDPFESLRISRDNLFSMGYRDWFER